MRRPLLAIAFCALLLLFFSAPTACYLGRGAWEEALILSHRKPIAELVRDGRVPEPERRKLSIVLAARDYARDSIHLKTKDSFTTFTQLHSDTLVLVLSAAYRDTLKPYTWWFPIVGTVPYKGYFDFDAARRAARDLAGQGFDIYLRPSDEFSTLGWFNDPLLSTTLQRDSLDLANTVIHEVTHNTFYAKGQAAFNESFAMFVGARGSAAFFRSRGSEAAARAEEARWADDKMLGAFWARLIGSIDSAFAAHPESRDARLAVRDTIYQRARAELRDSIAPKFLTIDPGYADRVALDNAALLARRVYASDLGLFDAVYDSEARNLKRAIARIIGLANSRPRDPFGAIRDWLPRTGQRSRATGSERGKLSRRPGLRRAESGPEQGAKIQYGRRRGSGFG